MQIILTRSLIAWLRPAFTVVGIAGIFALTGCGGGSGAPNNPYSPVAPIPVLIVQPLTLSAYAGVPTTISILSGAGPFQAFSSNPSVLPVSQNIAGNTIVLVPNAVTASELVTITVRDTGIPRSSCTSANIDCTSVAVSVSVQPAPIFNSLTFTPSAADCGTDLCSGQAGVAKVIATGPAGVPLAGRQIRFDVVYGPIGLSTTNPASTVTSTITVATDGTGTATARVLATPNATTQPAQVRATDVITGQQQIANFTVVNNTVAQGSPITVVPSTVNITGPNTAQCSSGFRIDYYVYGGTPPYTVSSTFPTGVTLVNTVVPNSGGFFEAITNGTCVNPLQFTIVDSAGKQTTAQLQNVPGTAPPPVAPPLAVTPGAVAANSCSGKTFTFLTTGGTAPYNAYVASYAGSTPPTITPNVVPNEGGTFAVTFTSPEPVSGVTTIVVGDSTQPQRTQTVQITCTAPAPPAPPPAPPALNVTPGFDYSMTSCVGQTSNFVITGGTPPYTVFFPTPPNAGATINPTTVTASGGGFSVTGLRNTTSSPNPGQLITNITIQDSGNPAQQAIRSIQCP